MASGRGASESTGGVQISVAAAVDGGEGCGSGFGAELLPPLEPGAELLPLEPSVRSASGSFRAAAHSTGRNGG